MPCEALPEHAGGAGVGAGSHRAFPSTLAAAQSAQSTVLSPRSSSTRIRSGRPQRPQLTLRKSSLAIAAFRRGPVRPRKHRALRGTFHGRGAGESSACHPRCARVAQACLCKSKLSPQLPEVRLNGGQGSPKVGGDRGVRETRDVQHTDQTLTLGEPPGPPECLRGAGPTLRLGTAL